MLMLIDISPPYPPQINQSYIPFGFYKFGVCCWVYQQGNGEYAGEIEWINTAHFCTTPKLPNPVKFRSWFQPNVIALITPMISVRTDIPDVMISNQILNAVTGKGMPPIFP